MLSPAHQVCVCCSAGIKEGCSEKKEFFRKSVTGEQALELKSEYWREIYHPEWKLSLMVGVVCLEIRERVHGMVEKRQFRVSDRGEQDQT